MSKFTKEEIRKELHEAVCNVTFTKVDGTLREMRCTLQGDIIPQEEFEKLKKNKHPRPDNVLAVWDLDKEAWRSFRVDSVCSLENVQ